jgi:hypothetical protein
MIIRCPFDSEVIWHWQQHGQWNLLGKLDDLYWYSGQLVKDQVHFDFDHKKACRYTSIHIVYRESFRRSSNLSYCLDLSGHKYSQIFLVLLLSSFFILFHFFREMIENKNLFRNLFCSICHLPPVHL